MTIANYVHTVRHLRPVQLYGRAWFRLYRPTPELSAAPCLRVGAGRWRAPARRRASLFGPDVFRFLNESHRVRSPGHWNDPRRDKLWLYNLHYFDDLNAESAGDRLRWHRSLIDRWIQENPPSRGNGWEPYPISLRLVNWIKWVLAGHPPETHWVQSLAVQARFLFRRLENHLLGNHLFANAKALVFAGTFFAGAEADQWRRKGLRVLRREVPEQVLADGGHFERSPMYHSIIWEDLLDLLNLAEEYPGIIEPPLLDAWRDVARRMGGWLKSMCHPDGEIALFNDAAFGVACSPGELASYCQRLGIADALEPQGADTHPAHHWLRHSGYVRIQRGAAAAFMDVGEIGPDYLPGHAHADTLSFELSLFGQRMLVNSGTSCYGTGPERFRQRSSAAHNTVVVDGESSSEVWSGFRVARRARPRDLALISRGEGTRLRCAHDGYRRLPGKPLHRRQWELGPATLTVQDRIQGEFSEAIAYFHFHPAVRLYADLTGQRGVALLPGGEPIPWEIRRGEGVLQRSLYHPRFGTSEPNRRMAVRLVGGEAKVVFRWC